jgi:transcriptional regulator with GAF, ATPase, and Fis domain
VLSIGQTLFWLGREDAAVARPLDLAAPDLPAPVPGLATFDPGFSARLERLALVAPKPLPVLLLGETGTGKEVVARALHQLSGRRGAFVAVNCGGIAPTLFEAELFGHRRGAFTGATGERTGYVRTADRGTLFLDEVGELPPPAQTALLRVLQEHEVVPIGEALPVPVDLRVCAATNRDLAALVAEGKFREDLYSRLAGLTIELPPLRERRADLGLLIPALLRRAGAEGTRFTWQAASALFEYPWPRNVRELERALELMVALAGDEPIALEHLPDEIAASAAGGPPERHRAAAEASPPLTAEEQELKANLERMLREHGDNLAEVARVLGKDRRQLYRWVHRLGIVRAGPDRTPS